MAQNNPVFPYKSCLFTGQRIEKLSGTDNYYEYRIDFNSYVYTFRFPLDNNLLERIVELIKGNEWIFRGMLFNNEWEIERETLITDILITRIIQRADYPKTFENKLLYYLLKCYNESGSTYKPITFIPDNYHLAYADSQDEHKRIIQAFLEKELFKKTNRGLAGITNYDFTEKGRELCRDALKQKKFSDSRGFVSGRKPVISIIAMNQDKESAESLNKFLLKYYAPTGINYVIDEAGLGSYANINNTRNLFYDNNYHYVIFIKSKLSDASTSYNSLLNIGIEAHLNSSKINNQYLFIGISDDSDFFSNPRLHDYPNSLYDIRLQSEKKRLLNNLANDWDSLKNTSQNSAQPEINLLSNTVRDLSKVDIYETPFGLRDKEDIEPAMGVEDLASDLAQLINQMTSEKGQMIGVFGKWGRGKTFLLTELWKKLKSNINTTNFIKVEYHAWKYQETPASWAYIYEQFTNEYLGKFRFGNYFNYCCRLLRLNFKRIGFLPIIKLLLGILIPSLLFFIPNIVVTFWLVVGSYIIGLSLSFTFISKDFSIKANDLIKKYSIRSSFKDSLGIQAEIQDELIKLLNVWIDKSETNKKKIILFVEDIDRCSHEKIIQNIDALRVLLEDDEICKRVIIIIAIDSTILKQAIEIKYDFLLKHLALTSGNLYAEQVNELTSEYLDKLFILAIKLGRLSNEHRQDYLLHLLKKESDAPIEEKVVETEKPYDFHLSEEQEKVLYDHFEKSGEKFDIAIEDGDFAVRDGDIAIKDSKGNITSVKAKIDDIVHDRIKNQKQLQKLAKVELSALSEIINIWSNATPRMIRIFYYRYLLAKKIIISRFPVNKINYWQHEAGIKILMELIYYYSGQHNPELVSTDKVRISSLPEERVPVENINTPLLVDKSDYLILLETLELVIAY